MRVLDLSAGKACATLSGGTAPVQACCFSPDGRRFAAGFRDDTVRVWDWAAGVLLCEWGVGSTVGSVAWRPDGGALVAGNKQGRVLLARVVNF